MCSGSLGSMDGKERQIVLSLHVQTLVSTSGHQVWALLTPGDTPVLCGLQQGTTVGQF